MKVKVRRSIGSSVSVPVTGVPLCDSVTALLLTLSALTGSLRRTTTRVLTGTSKVPAGGLTAVTVGAVLSAPPPVVKEMKKET